jgi:N-acyl-D-amino-acid deacylase
LPRKIVHDLPGGEWRRVQRARGYRYVLVNGAITIEDDRETNIYSGRLLRNGGGASASVQTTGIAGAGM